MKNNQIECDQLKYSKIKNFRKSLTNTLLLLFAVIYLVKINFDFLTIAYFSAIVLGLFSAFLLSFSRANKLANRLLSLLLLSITGWLVDAFFRVSNIYGEHPTLYFLPIYYSFAFGPLLYFYVRAITDNKFVFRQKYLIHFLPVLIQAGFYWIVTFQTYKTKSGIWFNLHLPYTYKIEYDGTWISLVLYLFFSLQLIKKYQVWIKNNFSNVGSVMLKWLSLCLILMIAICFAWLIEAILRDTQNIYYKYDYSTNFLCLVVYVLGIFSYRQANIELSFKSDLNIQSEKTVAVFDQSVTDKIIGAMKVDRLFLNPDLTLADLAQHIFLPTKIVSANLNSAFGKSFNSYINTWRVEEVKARLKSSDLKKLNLLGIAFDCGFNSKTTFNRIFKDYTGVSPSEYSKT